MRVEIMNEYRMQSAYKFLLNDSVNDMWEDGKLYVFDEPMSNKNNQITIYIPILVYHIKFAVAKTLCDIIFQNMCVQINK